MTIIRAPPPPTDNDRVCMQARVQAPPPLEIKKQKKGHQGKF